MSINLTDEIEVKTKKGKLGAAKQIFLEGDTNTVEKEIQDINSRHNDLSSKHELLSSTVSEHTNQIESNQSQITANKSAQDEKNATLDANIANLNTRDDQITETLNNIAVTGGASVASAVTYNNATSNLVSINVQGAIDELQGTKIDKTSILQESGDAEDKVMSQKATTDAIQTEIDRAKAAEEAIIFDVSVNNNGAVFESLQAILSSSNLNTLIPASVRHGGMSIRFIQGSEQSSDNKYVQYRLMSTAWSNIIADWQGVDNEPTSGSNNLVNSGGVAEKLSELGDKIEKLPNDYFDINKIRLSNNLLNPETCNTGFIISNGTIYTGDSYDNYIYTDFIPVESGKSYTLQLGEDTVIKGRRKANFARYCLYDGDRNVVSGGSDSPIQVLRIPDGVSFVRLSIYATLQKLSTDFFAVVEGEALIDFEQYSPIIKKSAILKPECNNDEHIKTIAQRVMPTDEHIKDVIGEIGESYTENNLFSKPIEGVNFWDNTFSWADSDSPNGSYCTYMFEVKPNTMYYFYQGFGYSYGARTINEYNASKVYISEKSISNISVYKTGADTKYLRVSFYRGNNSVIEIKEIIANGESVKAFIPDIVYCAVGRTIDIYNNQVCANADKYHFKWICGVGKSLKRKFSVKGVSASDKVLRLVIYDDYLNVRYAKEVTLKIISNTISTNHTIVPLGDSLTNGKNWLAEVETLSADKIAYVGTYNFSVEDSSGVQKTGSHDGRSGAEPIDYLTSASFSKGGTTYSNSWWDGSRFSFNAFKANTSKNPDCIQIWLGTNGIQNPEQASYIKQLVDNIRMDNTTIPIIVCDTIFRGNQNGIGNQGGVDGYSASGDSFKYNEDCRVITLKKNLHDLLVGYSNVFLVDLGISHDSEYNFETSEVPVNPRALQKEAQQVESVHPTSQGYFQIADILFSAYCGIFGE